MDIFSVAFSVSVLLETVSKIDLGVVLRSVEYHNYLFGVCVCHCAMCMPQ